MSNPFDDDYSPHAAAARGGAGEPNLYHRQVTDSLQSTLSSTTRSMQALAESERIGAETGEDLIRQREKLENTNRRLDEMNVTMNQTQRNLNSIKSIFGGVKNYFSKGPSTPKPVVASAADSDNTQRLQCTVEKARVADTAGFYTPTPADEKRPSARIPELRQHEAWNAMDEEIDNNLDLMSQNMRRIRELGMALGTEIEEQNDLIDNINEKTGKTGAEINRQDKQVRDILGVNRSKQKKSSTGGGLMGDDGGVSVPSPAALAAKAAVKSSNPFDGI